METQIGKWFLWLPFLIIVVVVFWFFSEIVIYGFLALILSLLGHPIIKFFDKIKMPRTISAGIALVTILGVFVGLFVLGAPVIVSQIEFITNVDIYGILNSFKEPINDTEDWLRQYNIISETETFESIISAYALNILHEIDLKNIINIVMGMIGTISIGGFSVLFIAYFFMKDDNTFSSLLKLFTPCESHDEIDTVLGNSKKFLSRYFLGLILEQLIMITIITIGMNIIGVKNALLIGLIAGIFNIIPYIGPIIGDVVGTIVGLATLQGADFATESVPLIIMMVVVFMVCNIIDNFVLQPIIYSKSVKAHPLEIFIVVMIAGIIAGPIGMILAIPTYTFVRIVAMEFFKNVPAIQKITKKLEENIRKEKNKPAMETVTVDAETKVSDNNATNEGTHTDNPIS